MKHLFYTSSQSAWKGFKTALTSAKQSIYIEMYIFIDDTAEGKELLGILAEKARSGIKVIVVLDAFGSKQLSAAAVDTLKSAGVEILFFKKLFRRLHRKIIVVDETIGFVGGVNIHHGARLWDDLLVRIEGKVVYSLIRSFAKVYKACGGKNGHLLGYRKKALWGGTRIWFLEHLPSIQRPRLRDYYTEAIVQATTEVVIITPYFLPHRWFKKLLRETHQRGVSIKIFVPENTDIALITKANYTYMRLLGQEGIVFYTLPTMNHAKLLLVDDSLALVGSQNIDALSFDFNAEAGLYFDDPAMIRDLRTIVEKWRVSGSVFDPHGSVAILDRCYSYIVRLVQPLL